MTVYTPTSPCLPYMDLSLGDDFFDTVKRLNEKGQSSPEPTHCQLCVWVYFLFLYIKIIICISLIEDFICGLLKNQD